MDQVDQSGSKCNQLMSSFELISLLWFIANLAAIRPQSVGLIDNIFLIHFSIFRERAACHLSSQMWWALVRTSSSLIHNVFTLWFECVRASTVCAGQIAFSQLANIFPPRIYSMKNVFDCTFLAEHTLLQLFHREKLAMARYNALVSRDGRCWR